jgi:hypothetical protein
MSSGDPPYALRESTFPGIDVQIDQGAVSLKVSGIFENAAVESLKISYLYCDIQCRSVYVAIAPK